MSITSNVLNPEGKVFFATWADTLRGDEYTQISSTLRDDSDGRCCLGVLCDLTNIGGDWKIKVAVSSEDWEFFSVDEANASSNPKAPFGSGHINSQDLFYYFEGDSKYEMPPDSVVKQLALNFNVNHESLDFFFSQLAEANDGGFFFDDIANLIDWAIDHNLDIDTLGDFLRSIDEDWEG